MGLTGLKARGASCPKGKKMNYKRTINIRIVKVDYEQDK